MDPGGGARSRGIMNRDDVRPTTAAVVASIDDAMLFGFSVEASGGANTLSEQVVVVLPVN